MSKGYSGFRGKAMPTKGEMWEGVVSEFPMIQKAAYEAKYAAEMCEKLVNADHGMLVAIQEMVVPLIDLLMKKNIITVEEMDISIAKYINSKRAEEDSAFNEKYGWENVEGPVSEASNLAVVEYELYQDDKKVFTKSAMPVLVGKKCSLPGLEAQVLGMKQGEIKEYKTTEAIQFLKGYEGKEITVKFVIARIKRKKVVDENPGTPEAQG